ncbi:MAG: hypothetical protein IJY90_00640 [Clostridia bacterium]|nr:hypothetical protein [Clostridia bacterium]
MAQAKANKKFKVAIASMAIAFVAVVGGLVGVWAATSQTIGSSFDVQYTVNGAIAGNITATYKTAADDTATTFGEHNFDVTASDPTAENKFNKQFTIADEELELSATNQSVVFTYSFYNVGETEFTAKLTDTCAQQNVEVVYEVDGEEVELTDNAYTVTVPVTANDADSAVVVTITVSIADVNKSAWYTSDVDAGTQLLWELNAVAA